ncbi:MAG: glycyl-radical enzyme activating protein [Opitutaceae bacterium]|nr:glycyl-radical enzyme activating protein [Opitutaceae bacterium]
MNRKPSSAQGGYVFDVQRSSLHDGPGVRTTVFLKGCPLRCVWCHNPESQSPRPELSFDSTKCLSCGACASACDRGAHTLSAGGHAISREACSAEGKCVDACAAGALKLYGAWRSTDSLLEEVEKDRCYYTLSGGGLTLSGGEPTAQPEFALALLRGARQRNIHTALETCGIAAWPTLERFLEVTDLFLFDYKATGSELHRRLTGTASEPILANLKRLLTAGANVLLRCPLIPGVNTTDAHFDAIRDLKASAPGLEVEIIPYHTTGENKYDRLGRPRPQLATSTPTVAEISEWESRLS